MWLDCDGWREQATATALNAEVAKVARRSQGKASASAAGYAAGMGLVMGLVGDFLRSTAALMSVASRPMGKGSMKV